MLDERKARKEISKFAEIPNELCVVPLGSSHRRVAIITRELLSFIRSHRMSVEAYGIPILKETNLGVKPSTDGLQCLSPFIKGDALLLLDKNEAERFIRGDAVPIDGDRLSCIMPNIDKRNGTYVIVGYIIGRPYALGCGLLKYMNGRHVIVPQIPKHRQVNPREDSIKNEG